MNESILTPNLFTIGGRNYYLASIFGLINGDDSSNFFEFLIFNDIKVKKILLWKQKEDVENDFFWILFLGENFSFNNAKFIINKKEDDDMLYFLNFVKDNTPQALPYILFNYLN